MVAVGIFCQLANSQRKKMLILFYIWISWRRVTYPLSQKGAFLTATLYTWELAHLMDIDGDTDDNNNDRSPCWKKWQDKDVWKWTELFQLFSQQRKMTYPSCIPDILLHKVYILHNLGLELHLYSEKSEKPFIFTDWRHINCYENILVCSLFWVSHRAIMKSKTIIKDLCIVHIFISINLID